MEELKNEHNEYEHYKNQQSLYIYNEIQKIINTEIPVGFKHKIISEEHWKLIKIRELFSKNKEQLNDMIQGYLDKNVFSPYDKEGFDISFTFFLHPIDHIEVVEDNFKKVIDSRMPILDNIELVKLNNNKSYPIGLPYPNSKNEEK